MSIYKVANYYQIKLAQNVQSTFGQISKLLNLAQRLEARLGQEIPGLLSGQFSQQPQYQKLETTKKEPVQTGFLSGQFSQQKELQQLQESISGKKTYPTDELKTFQKDFESKQKPHLLAAIQSAKNLYSTIYNKGIDASNFKFLLDKIKSSLLNSAMAGYTTELTTDMLKLAQSIVPIDMPSQKPKSFIESHVPKEQVEKYKKYLQESSVAPQDISSNVPPKK